jgi:hypothetical protein
MIRSFRCPDTERVARRKLRQLDIAEKRCALLDQEFLQPLSISQYRLAKAIDVPASRICASAAFWD